MVDYLFGVSHFAVRGAVGFHPVNETLCRYSEIYIRRFIMVPRSSLAKRLSHRLRCDVQSIARGGWLTLKIKDEDKEVKASNTAHPDGSLQDRRADAKLCEAIGEGREVPETALSSGEATMVKATSLPLAPAMGDKISPPIKAWVVEYFRTGHSILKTRKKKKMATPLLLERMKDAQRTNGKDV